MGSPGTESHVSEFDEDQHDQRDCRANPKKQKTILN